MIRKMLHKKRSFVSSRSWIWFFHAHCHGLLFPEARITAAFVVARLGTGFCVISVGSASCLIHVSKTIANALRFSCSAGTIKRNRRQPGLDLARHSSCRTAGIALPAGLGWRYGAGVP